MRRDLVHCIHTREFDECLADLPMTDEDYATSSGYCNLILKPETRFEGLAACVSCGLP